MCSAKQMYNSKYKYNDNVFKLVIFYAYVMVFTSVMIQCICVLIYRCNYIDMCM